MRRTLATFTALEWYELPSGGRVALVACDRERPRGDPGLRGLVEIDGRVYECIGVERNLPAIPIQPGERIGLRVRNTEPGVSPGPVLAV